MKSLNLTILLFCLAVRITAQSVTVISDGPLGFNLGFENDTVFIDDISVGPGPDIDFLHVKDKVIFINGSKVSGERLQEQDIINMAQGSRGSKIQIKLMREGVDSLLTFTFFHDAPEEPYFDCFYDYLSDPGGRISALQLFQAPSKYKFSSVEKNGATIFSTEGKTPDGKPDLKPGDLIVNFSRQYYSWTKLFFQEFYDNDTVLTVQRDSSVLLLHEDLRDYRTLKIRTVLQEDLATESVWFRTILDKKMTADKSFLLRIIGSFDTIVLYRRGFDGSITESRNGEKYAGSVKNSYFKNYPVFRLDLRKEGSDTLYLKITRAGGINHPVGLDFLTLDYVNDFEKTERLILGSMLGMMFIIALYYFIIFFFLKDKGHLWFLLYIISLIFTLFYLSGYGPQFLWTGAIEYFNNISVLFSVLPVSLFAVFGAIYLDISSSARRIYKTGKVVLAVTWILTMLVLLDSIRNIPDSEAGFRTFCEEAAIFGTMFIGILIIVGAVVRLRQSYKPAKGFMLGLIISFFSLLAYNFSNKIGLFLSDKLGFSGDISAMFTMASIYIGAIFQFLVFSVIMGKKMRDDNNEMKNAQHRIIEQLQENEQLREKVNRELEEKVRDRTREIEAQKNLLEEQKQEITDSINYAKRIQTAILPADEVLDKLLPGHFILYRPRDIVSGDFFWIKKINNYVVIVVADCTGHGVPGAFMSMLGLSLLNEQVSRSRFDSAGEILNRLRKKVKETLGQEGRYFEQKDGMDLALAIVNTETLEMQFSGAFNPVYIVRKKSNQADVTTEEYPVMESDDCILVEIKGDRQPVSIYYSEKEFTTNRFQLQPSDEMYLFSDGYMDQIGGPHMKKFMYKSFKNLLLSTYGRSHAEQRQLLESTLDKWQGDNPQVDDITVVGVRW